MPLFMSHTVIHLIEALINTSIFPECLKKSQIILLRKPKKSEILLDAFGPINNLNSLEEKYRNSNEITDRARPEVSEVDPKK